MIQEITIDLRRPPEDRWRFTPDQQSQALELLNVYKADLGIQPETGESLAASTRELVSGEHWAEIESLSHLLQVPLSDIVVGNLYYDILKLVIGCTAFAVDSPSGVLHARNLDWWTKNAILSRYSTICHFVGGGAGPFTTIGWPGFVGALSGVAPGRFAITLNAVLSSDPTTPAAPVSFVLRRTFEEARSFKEAQMYLSEAHLASDCLLLLTGTQPGEFVVIERTPSRSAARRGESGFLCVTNDYRELQAGIGNPTNEITLTSCGRYDRIKALMSEALPQNPDDCFRYLSDPAVTMQCTTQQMVLNASRGTYLVNLPKAETSSGQPF